MNLKRYARRMCSFSSRLHFVATLALTLAIATGATGCVGRNQALVTTQRLKTSSEQASAIVLLAKTNEAAGVQTHRDLRLAYRQLTERAWQGLLEGHQKSLEIESQKTLVRIEAEKARILGGRLPSLRT